MKAIICQILSRLVQKSPRAAKRLGMMVGFVRRVSRSTAAHPMTPLISVGAGQIASWVGGMKAAECKQEHLQLSRHRRRSDPS